MMMKCQMLRKYHLNSEVGVDLGIRLDFDL